VKIIKLGCRRLAAGTRPRSRKETVNSASTTRGSMPAALPGAPARHELIFESPAQAAWSVEHLGRLRQLKVSMKRR